METEFLSLKEAAVIFSVSEITLRRAIKKGLICAIKIGNGKNSSYRISKKLIEDIHRNQIKKHNKII